MSKPLEDGMNGIGRGLAAKNIDESLELPQKPKIGHS